MKKIETILKVLSGLGFLSGAIAGLLKQKIETETYIFWGLTAFFVIGLLVVSFLRQRETKKKSKIVSTIDTRSPAQLHRDQDYRKKQYNIDSARKDNGVDNGFVQVLLRHSVLEYLNPEATKIGHEKTVHVKALVNGVRNFHDRYHYSADHFDNDHKHGICVLTAPRWKQSIVEIKKTGQWVFYTVHSEDAIRQNHSREFYVKMEPIDDPNRAMECFLSSGIHDPLQRLDY